MAEAQSSNVREERKEQAAKHIGLMKSAFGKETGESVASTVIYNDGEGRELELGEATAAATETIVTTSFAPEALRRWATEGKSAIVDAGSFTRPGGAYEDGAMGPEQILCAESNLYQVLQGLKEAYHDKNRDYRRGMLFTDRAAYIPDVAFLRSGSIQKADVALIAEPLRARAIENHRSERECDIAIATRIETIMRIAAANSVSTLIVGAFGCGKLGYPTEQVIELFQKWIAEHPGAIERVVFAVPRAFADAFHEAFDMPEEEVAPAANPDSEEEDDAEDWRNIELPEGITLR